MENSERRSWYLGLTPDQVGDRAILVGDRGRIDLIADRLTDVTRLNEDRGLRVVTGTHRDTTITAAAFGMGAPIAAIVLEELASLGASIVLRLGTAMTLDPADLGSQLLAEGALTGESTSRTYVPAGFPAIADFSLQLAVRDALARSGCPWRSGLFASYDGFYTEMLALDPTRQESVVQRVQQLRALGILAMDMETSTILAVGKALGVRAGSLCLASVGWEGATRLGKTDRARGENQLIDIGLEALHQVPA